MTSARSELLDHQQAAQLADAGQAELAALMRTYEIGLLRQSQALAEAVSRGLLPPCNRENPGEARRWPVFTNSMRVRFRR